MKLNIIVTNKFPKLFLILIFIIKDAYSSYLILTFKTESLEKYSNNFIQSKFDINLHTYLELGNPKQKIKTYFRDEFFSFFITEKNTTYNEKEAKEPIIPPQCIKENINSFYNPKLSSTYKNVSDYKSFFIDIYYRKGFLSSETFYFNTNQSIKKLTEYNGIDFILINRLKPHRTLISGAIGLLPDEYYLEGAQSFSRMVVKKNVVNFCLFSKRYYNDEYGYFIFGDFPHVFEEDICHKEQYVETDIKLNVYKQKWNLEFDEIFFRVKNKDFDNEDDNENDFYINDIYNYYYLNTTLYGEIKHNLGLIIGTVEYQKLIEENFFNYYIKENICHKEKILINDFHDDKVNYTYYYCDKNDKLFNKNNFPSLYLNQMKLKYIFELDHNNLFALNNNKWYFLIIFEGEEIANPIHKWMFGEPFLKKYQFVFDPLNYKIGFYNPTIPYLEKKDKKDDKKNEYNNGQIISFFVLILFISCFLIVICYYFYKKKLFKRKINLAEYIELKNVSLDKYSKYTDFSNKQL